MRIGFGVLVVAALAQVGVAQAPARPEPMGTITGHVFCRDTQRPARLAKVSLVSAARGPELGGKEAERAESLGVASAGEPIETSLDGSFTLHNVRPGEYYLIVDMDGYVVPLAQFTAKEMAHPTDAVKERMAKTLHAITVRPDQATNEEVMLDRGASVNGTVTYDDGSPAGGLAVAVLTKDSDGKWQTGIGSRYRSSFGFQNTDDFGHFRVTGLPPGEYIAEVDLALNEYTSTTGPMPGFPDRTMTTRMSNTKFRLPIYSGNVWRKTTAVAFTLGAAEQRTGADMQFPLTRLHKVSGQLLAKDGHVLNGGSLTLLNADDKTKVTEAEVQTADSGFHLEFVPEGQFDLKVAKPRDVVQVQVANAPGFLPRFHEETRTIKTYGDTEQDLTVAGDKADVLVMVPEAKPAR